MGNIGALSRCHARHGDPGAEVRCGIISRGVTIRERADREKLCVNTERARAGSLAASRAGTDQCTDHVNMVTQARMLIGADPGLSLVITKVSPWLHMARVTPGGAPDT